MQQLMLFDYNQLDPETRIVVQQRTSEIKTLMKRTAQDIIEIGEKLIEVKERLPHGAFGGWLDVEFEWSDRTARKYMSIADAFSNRKNSSDLVMSFETMAYLAAPSTPEEARTEAVSRAQNGERITHGKAKDIVDNHKNTNGAPGQPPHTASRYRPNDKTREINLTRNRRTVWTIPTQPYGGAHFAVFPPALVEPCILAGCPAGGVVLDPFLGSGTVAQVAIETGRDWLGVELNPEYIKLAEQRIAAARPVLPGIFDAPTAAEPEQAALW
jgi:hypothetical protein